MSDPQEKTVGHDTSPPQEASLARLKQSLESCHQTTASTLSGFLAERFARTALDPATAQKPMPASAYELGRILAKGGMGAILSARDTSIQRTVAVKVILTGAEASDEHIHRLVTEARITGQLEHPNIVPLHELGVTADGVVYYTMRLVEGVTLSEVLEKIRLKDPAAIAKYPLRTLLTVFQKICDAVAFAHSRGVVHRDLKPDNLMLGEFGEVFVMDWGLAKRMRAEGREVGTTHLRKRGPVVQDLSGDSFKTLSGQVKGTPRYMAPEQAEGRVEDIDERTDIYALGAILYAMLTLHPPVAGETVNEVLTQVASGTISPPTSYNPRHTHISRLTHPAAAPRDIAPPELVHCPDRRIPSALSAVAMKALARDSAKRYPTVAALQLDIAAYQGGFATAAEQASAARLLLLLVRRHRTEFVLSFVSLALMLALAAHFTSKVTRTLAELKETAPTFFVEARTLVDEFKFAKALAKIDYAISLQPDDPKFHALKGNILQSLLQLAAARDSYANALELDPETLHADRNLKLCEMLLAENTGRTSLLPSSLAALRSSMAQQQRTAEAIAMSTRESNGLQATFDSWKAVVKKLGMEGQLKREAGGLSLSVNQPAFSDLSPFRTAPLTRLDIGDTQVDDLSPLKDMRLTALDISGTRVSELAQLKGMRLVRLDAARIRALDFSALAGMKLVSVNLAHTRIASLAPLKGAPLRHLQLEGCTNLTDFSLLAECRQLEGITLPVGARSLEVLRNLPRLRHIGYTLPEGGWEQVPLAEDFWRVQEARPINGKQQ
ncbi:MAG: protein kinase [Verrucomicrobia bacterium]|nr:protein kinase [Verrucomicrobiota bacterium]